MELEKLKGLQDITLDKIESQSQKIRKEQGQICYSAIPKNRRLLILTVITLGGFLGPLSGNIYIPILPLLSKVFAVSQTVMNGTVSIFMIGFAFFPLFWASMADFGGRKNLYIISLLFFLLANILIIVVPQNIGALYVLRLLQSFGASSVTTLGIGTVVDLVEPKHRGKSIALFMLGPQLGPVIGPILSLSASKGNWRWPFGILLIIGGLVYLMILFFVPETLRYLVGNGEIYGGKNWVILPKLYQKKVVDDPRYVKPPKPGIKVYYKLIKYPPVLLCSITSALLFACFYALSVSFSSILESQYDFSTTQVCLSYLCLGGSLIIGSLLSGRFTDRYYRKKSQSEAGYVPEDRLVVQLFGFISSLVGLICYGWMVQIKSHVALIYVFSFLSGIGMTWVFVICNTYLAESIEGAPATPIAIANALRNVAAAIASFIIYKLEQELGYGWCFTGLGLLNVINIILLISLCVWGRKWRSNFTK